LAGLSLAVCPLAVCPQLTDSVLPLHLLLHHLLLLLPTGFHGYGGAYTKSEVRRCCFLSALFLLMSSLKDSLWDTHHKTM
jgi:hypothetical protein